MSALRVACIGAGYFSRFHIESWTRLDVVLAGISDIDRTRAEATGLPVFDHIEHLLSATKPDLVDVILPPSAQAQVIRTVLAKGARAIICQKPFCRDLTEARALTAEAEAAGIPLIVHENFRHQPWYRVMRHALDQRRIGTLHQMTQRMRTGDGQGPAAYLDRQPYFRDMTRFLIHETGVHWIDVFRYLLGEPRAVYADLRQLNPAIAGEDAGLVIFEFDHGVRAVFDGNRHLDHATDDPRRTLGEALLEGSAGTLSLSGDGAVHFRQSGQIERQELLSPSRDRSFGGDCVHRFQSHVIAALCGDGRFETPARDYLRVLEIEEAIYRSSASGQRVTLEMA